MEEIYSDLERIIDGFSYERGAWDDPPTLVIRENEWANWAMQKYRAPLKTIEEYVDYINQNDIKAADIRVKDLSFLSKCPSLRRLSIMPPIGYYDEFDYSPLYNLSGVETLWCASYYGLEECLEIPSRVDFSKIDGEKLVCLGVEVTPYMKNFEGFSNLKSLFLSDFKGKHRDLTDAFCSKQLDVLGMTCCGVRSLKGIEQSEKMTWMSMVYCRSLEDISDLISVKDTLKVLLIENCGKIKDFSVLGELENLEELSLVGNNRIPNLKFLKKLRNLKIFDFSVNVEDGDLTPCLDIPTVISYRHRRHYNIKEKDLPKAKERYRRESAEIEWWRRGNL